MAAGTQTVSLIAALGPYYGFNSNNTVFTYDSSTATQVYDPGDGQETRSTGYTGTLSDYPSSVVCAEVGTLTAQTPTQDWASPQIITATLTTPDTPNAPPNAYWVYQIRYVFTPPGSGEASFLYIQARPGFRLHRVRQHPALACLFLTRDAHRRPLAAGAGAGAPASGYYSNTAGHTFQSSVIDADATCADVSLLVDRHLGRYSALYTKGKPGSQALFSAFGPVVDGFPPDKTPAPANGVSGLFPIACEHPVERGAALMLLVQSAALVCAETGDGGETWTQAGTVAAGVDLSASGPCRPVLSGGRRIAVYGSGKGIACAKSADRGKNWTACASAGGSGPYSGLSLLGWQGTLYLLAFAPP